ncbi:hypothetical protein BDW69DRAFT_182578 [Aspergillus filifer]
MSGRRNSSFLKSGSDQGSRSQERAPLPPQRLYNEGSRYSHNRQNSSGSDDLLPGLRYERPPPPALARTDEEIRADLFRLNAIPVNRNDMAESHRIPSFQGPFSSQGRTSSSGSRSTSRNSSGRASSRTGGPQEEHGTPPRSVPSALSNTVQGPSPRERSGVLARGSVSQSQPPRPVPAHTHGLFPREREITSARSSRGQSQTHNQTESQSQRSVNTQSGRRQSRSVLEAALAQTQPDGPQTRRQSRTVLEDAFNDSNSRQVTRFTSRRAHQGRDALIRSMQQSSGTDRSGQSGSGATKGRGIDSGPGRSGSASGRGETGKWR